MTLSCLPVRRLLPLCALVFSSTACPGEPRVEAPDDLEGLARFFFTQQADATDEEMNEAIENAHAVMTELLGDSDAKVGALEALSEEDVAPLELGGERDPSLAPGLFLVKRFTCELDVLEEILTYPDQPAVHPGVYDSYDRVFVGDRDEWLAADEGALDWSVTYEATPTSTQYLARTKSAIRHVPKLEAPVGPTLVQRTVLREPAEFDGDPENHVFDQDYQAELFIAAGDGEILHLYGLWRYMQLGIVSVNDDVFIDFQVDGMIQWDDQTEAACESWPALPEG